MIKFIELDVFVFNDDESDPELLKVSSPVILNLDQIVRIYKHERGSEILLVDGDILIVSNKYSNIAYNLMEYPLEIKNNY